MPTFLDESGDPGWNEDSNPYFTLAAVWFERPEDAFACETAIETVRTDLGVASTFEFKFTRISPEQRVAFLTGVAACSFEYVTCTLYKQRAGGRWLEGREWRKHEYLFERVIAPVVDSLAFCYEYAQLCKESPLNERVTFDEHTDPVYCRVLRNQFQKPKATSGRSLVNKVRPAKSRSNRLVQLADMVCGATVHTIFESNEYAHLIRGRRGDQHVLP
jgi:hypothetical protein